MLQHFLLGIVKVGDEGELFFSENYIEEFEMINHQNFYFIHLKFRVVRHFPSLAKMCISGLTFGELKTMCGCPLVDFLDALL